MQRELPSPGIFKENPRFGFRGLDLPLEHRSSPELEAAFSRVSRVPPCIGGAMHLAVAHENDLRNPQVNSANFGLDPSPGGTPD